MGGEQKKKKKNVNFHVMGGKVMHLLNLKTFSGTLKEPNSLPK